MTRYRIHKAASSTTIQLTEVGAKQQQLLEAFQECAEGRCSCPTNEYDKLASIDIESDDDDIEIRLESRPGSEFETSQIADCLDHTIAAAESGGDSSEPEGESSVG